MRTSAQQQASYLMERKIPGGKRKICDCIQKDTQSPGKNLRVLQPLLLLSLP